MESTDRCVHTTHANPHPTLHLCNHKRAQQCVHCCSRARSSVWAKRLPRRTEDIPLGCHLYHAIIKNHLACTVTSHEEKPDTKEICKVWDKSNSLIALKNCLFLDLILSQGAVASRDTSLETSSYTELSPRQLHGFIPTSKTKQALSWK